MQYLNQKLRAEKNWPAEKIKKWSARLGYVTNELVKATNINTTQAVMMDTDKPNHSTMKMRMKRRFPFLNCKYVIDVAYADIMHTTSKTGTSHDVYTLAVVVCLRDKNIFKAYPMKKKSDAYEMIQKLFIEECIPIKIVTDSAGELVGKEWKKICKKYRLISRQVETVQQWQDRV